MWQFPCPDEGDRYHVKLLDLYAPKLPDEAKQKDPFYFTPCRALQLILRRKKPWFTAVPIRDNKLETLVKEMFSEVSIDGKTNHSLQATGATRMYCTTMAFLRRQFNKGLATRVSVVWGCTSDQVKNSTIKHAKHCQTLPTMQLQHGHLCAHLLSPF